MGTYGPFGWWPYRLPLWQFNSHFYIVGRSGSGKSKFIEGLIWQLIQQGQGCALIDPHADSAQHLLKLIAFHKDRSNQAWLDNPSNAAKLIYCEPGRRDYVLPWNLFKSHGDPYTIATNIWEAFRRTWHQSLSAAPQSKNIAIHSLLLLIEQNRTLPDLPRLFIDEAFRNRLVSQSRNPEVVKFFNQRFKAWGKQGVQRAEPLLNKVTALTLNDNLRWMLGANDNRLNLREIMDRGQVLLVNLGLCDQETRALMGSLFTVSLEQAAMSRIKTHSKFRRPFYCIVDEFQGLVDTDGSSHILSETRKAGLRFGFAHQGQYQLPKSRFQSTQEQTPFKILFGCGGETARSIAKEISTPRLGNKELESTTQQREQFVQQLKNLQPRHIVVWRLGDKPRFLKTLVVPVPTLKADLLEDLKSELLERMETTFQHNSDKTVKQRLMNRDSRSDIRSFLG
ncbi:MAG: DUF87 domain-containing protein [Anaerolineae bacterium]